VTARPFLIVKLAAAGDVLAATACARELRRLRPHSPIAWLTTPYAAPLLAANPDLDAILEVPAPPAGLLPRLRAAAAWRAALAPWRRRHPGAIALLAHRSPALALLLRASGIAAVAGFDNRRNWGLAAVAPFSPALHRLALHAGLLRAALSLDGGAPPAFAAAAPRLHLHPDEAAAGERRWSGAAGPRWTIAPGGAANPWSAMPNRLWPRARFLDLARRARASGIALRWIGGPADAALTAWLTVRLGRPGDDLAARLSLRETAAVIAASSLLIGNDSLPLALAHALARPHLGLFGPTPAASIHAPGQPFLQGLAGCGPCYDPRAGLRGMAYACPHARCMEQISTDAVWRLALRAAAPPECAAAEAI
jgi:ADP-heptose:LPS heptosyltransferase